MSRPRLLFLGHTLPYPPDGGAALRSYHMLRVLAEHYDVDALLFHRRHEPTQMPLEARVRHLREHAHVEIFPIPGEWSGRRRAWDRARGVVSGRSPSRWRFDSHAYRRRVLELLFERDPRIVHVDSLALHTHLPLLASRPVVLAHHHVESERLRGKAKLARGLDRRRLEADAEWAERTARRWLPRVTLNTVCSESDRAALAALAPEARIETVPLGVDTRHFTPGQGTGQGLAFVGGSGNVVNRDALDYFAGEILPRLRREVSVQTLEPISWVGVVGEGDRTRARELGIDLTGYVEDIRPIVRPTACYVVPVRIGTGRATRILQAWAMGKAVVSTSVGCEGVAAVDGENVLIRDDAPTFARAVADVLRDRELRLRLGEAGRRTVESHHDWDDIGADMVARYGEAESAGALRAPAGGGALD